jgi:beta-lactam-binding protein with PASTA domain
MDRTSMLPELPPDMIMPRRRPEEDFAPPPAALPAQRRAGRSGRRRRSWLLPLSVLVVVGLIGGGVTYALNSALYLSMPSVVGQAQGTAEQQLQNDGLTVAVAQQFDAAIPAGQVISTDPAAGASVRKDSTVTLEVSRGADRPPVPNVVGMTQAAAESAITGADLTVGTVTQQSSSSVSQGKVISADPGVGTPEQPKTLVNLVVSSGAQPVNLPNVVGEPVAQATSDLQNAGFAVQVNPNQVSSAVPAGSVASVNPAGSSAAAGSTVTLTVSSGPAQATVPDVSGDTEAQARAALNAAGFKVKVHHYSLFGTPTVVSQDPGGGSQADQGSTVTITLF